MSVASEPTLLASISTDASSPGVGMRAGSVRDRGVGRVGGSSRRASNASVLSVSSSTFESLEPLNMSLSQRSEGSEFALSPRAPIGGALDSPGPDDLGRWLRASGSTAVEAARARNEEDEDVPEEA